MQDDATIDHIAPAFGARRRSSAHLARVRIGLLTACCFLSVATTASAQGANTTGSAQVIASLIDDLSNASYEKRTTATRKLCEIGGPAIAALSSAAHGSDAEKALRAKAVLRTLDRLFFSGVEVSLAFEKRNAAWNEPIDLKITFNNPTPFEARVPFELAPDRRKALADQARQVGDMLDLSECLTVIAPNGQPVGLHVNDMNDDASVAQTVRHRLEGLPISSVPPGSTRTITVSAFNRGWARYRLLDAGTYRVQFEYVPAWEDAVLADEKVGRVVSSPQTLRITNSAPSAVSRSGALATLRLRREGTALVAELLNQSDQPTIINENLGSAVPFAKSHWIYTSESEQKDISYDAASSLALFQEAKMVTVLPGETTEISRVAWATLAKSLEEHGVDPFQPNGTIHFSYSNLLNREWQQRHGKQLPSSVPAVLRTPLPARILTGRFTTSPLPAKHER